MTGYTVHTGSNDKFSSGWDRAFSGTPAKASKAEKAPAAKKADGKKPKSKKKSK
jgi:hypothetical protein